MLQSRLQNSIKNLASGFLSRFLIIILGFVVRTVFIKTLGNNYLSVNGLYSNILNMLSLAELGFSTAMVYSMYRPLSEDDQAKLASLLALYKKVYQIIGFVILGAGLCLIPFMDYIIKDPPNVQHLTFYYLLFLINSALSYWFFAYKRSILTADQKEYICTNYHNIFNIIKSVVQIIVLLILNSFTVYLLVQLVCTVLENVSIARYAEKKYPALKQKKAEPLPKEELRAIWKNVRALMLSRLGHVILNSTDNIIISAFVGIGWVGLLSNFTLITDSVTGVLCVVTSALSASLGNYFVEKSKEESYLLFERVEFLNSWLYGFSSICLVILLNPFVTLWLGEKYVLSESIICVLTLNFFVQGYMNTLWTFRSTLGLFNQGWFRPVIVAAVNIVASIILGIKFGTIGVLFATFLARASINIWFDPWIIHKYGFNKSVNPFFRMYIIRIAEIISIIGVLEIIKYYLLFEGITLVKFSMLLVLTVLIIFFMFWLYSRKRDEYYYFCQMFRNRILTPFCSKFNKKK